MQFSRCISGQMFRSNWLDTMHVVCTDLGCVVCNGLLSTEFSTVNTALGRHVLKTSVSVEYLLQFSTHK